METFNIYGQNDAGIPFIDEVKGERIDINGIPCFIFEDIEHTPQGDIVEYNISHLETGMRAASSIIRDEAISRAKFNFEKFPDALEKARLKANTLGFRLPANV